MSLTSPLTARAWIAIPLLALGFLLWSHSAYRARVEYVTGTVSSDAVVSAGSPTGYAGEIRELILPEQNTDSARWIAQTQQMLARGEWRVRHIDYENAPFGREVRLPRRTAGGWASSPKSITSFPSDRSACRWNGPPCMLIRCGKSCSSSPP